jgi:hypothetical protein
MSAPFLYRRFLSTNASKFGQIVSNKQPSAGKQPIAQIEFQFEDDKMNYLHKMAPRVMRSFSTSPTSKSAISVSVPSGPAVGAMTTDEEYAIINEGIPPEHLIAPYGDPTKMLGTNGKLINKLPKGTVVGKFVMGDHGLYSPSYRARQLQLLRCKKAGLPYYMARGKIDAYAYYGMMTMVGTFVCLTFYNIFCFAFKIYPSLWTLGVVPEKYQKKRKNIWFSNH